MESTWLTSAKFKDRVVAEMLGDFYEGVNQVIFKPSRPHYFNIIQQENRKNYWWRINFNCWRKFVPLKVIARDKTAKVENKVLGRAPGVENNYFSLPRMENKF